MQLTIIVGTGEGGPLWGDLTRDEQELINMSFVLV